MGSGTVSKLSGIKASTASVQVTVAKVVASVYTATISTQPLYGAPVTVNALLLGADGDPVPTGTVTFSDAGATLASVPVGPDTVAPVSDELMALSLRPNGEPATSSAIETDVAVG